MFKLRLISEKKVTLKEQKLLPPFRRNSPYPFMETFFSFFFLYHLSTPRSTTQFQLLFLLSYFTNYTLKLVSILNYLFLWDGGSILYLSIKRKIQYQLFEYLKVQLPIESNFSLYVTADRLCIGYLLLIVLDVL